MPSDEPSAPASPVTVPATANPRLPRAYAVEGRRDKYWMERSGESFSLSTKVHKERRGRAQSSLPGVLALAVGLAGAGAGWALASWMAAPFAVGGLGVAIWLAWQQSLHAWHGVLLEPGWLYVESYLSDGPAESLPMDEIVDVRVMRAGNIENPSWDVVVSLRGDLRSVGVSSGDEGVAQTICDVLRVEIRRLQGRPR
jgi:hypothetical protein